MGDLRVEHYADFGSAEPWVARTILALPDLVSATPAFGSRRAAFNECIGEVFFALGMAFEDLRALRQLRVDDAPALSIEKAYAGLYGHLWQAYKDRFQSAVKALGVDLGFMYGTDAAFEKGALAEIAAHPEHREVVDLVRRCRARFQNALAHYRNVYLEHRDDAVPDPRMLASFHDPESAEMTFDDVWKAIEAIVAGLVVAHLPPQLALAEIPEDERDPSIPKRFRWVIRHAVR